MLQLYTVLHVIEAQLRQECMHACIQDPRQHLAGYVHVDASDSVAAAGRTYIMQCLSSAIGTIHTAYTANNVPSMH